MASSAADDSGAIVDAIRQSSGSGNTEAVQRAIDGSGSGDINAIVTIKVGEVSLHSANPLSCSLNGACGVCTLLILNRHSERRLPCMKQ